MVDSKEKSYTQILKSSSIIGGASVINILIGLLKIKVVAVLLGPAGVGLIGLLQSLVATGAQLAAVGLGNAGTRQIADAVGRGDPLAISASRRALFWGTMGMALLGATAFWLLRGLLADKIFGDPDMKAPIGWLAIGVALTVAAGSQGALLNGLRRIGDIARINVLSAVLSTGLGVAAVWGWGEKGILAFVISAPVATFLLGHWYVSRLPGPAGPSTPIGQLFGEWTNLVRLGAAFMVAGVAVSIGHLTVRTLVQRELGAAYLGQFQAAWIISMTYVGFVLHAMGADYYPRLTAVIGDKAAVNKLVNEQTEIAFILASPIFLAMLGLAPWIIELLYSNQFADAVRVLRWQVLGDILKVASWPMGFIILAAGDGRTFMLKESLVIVIFVGLTWFGLPRLGIEATGTAFVGMYAVNVSLVYWLARWRTGFAWERGVRAQFVFVIVAAILVFLSALWSELFGTIIGLVAGMAFGLYGIGRLGQMTKLRGPARQISLLSRNLLTRIGVRFE